MTNTQATETPAPIPGTPSTANPAPQSGPSPALPLRKEDFDDLLDRAAERGAERVLVHLGLENGHAARDIRELRDLLEVWRDTRRTAWQTVVRMAIKGLLIALIVGIAVKLKILGGGQ